jgi:hypothetical protein
MGRQTQIHMLAEDCRRFVRFLRERDPVVVTPMHSDSTAEIEDCAAPWDSPDVYCVWNQALLTTLHRRQTGKYFNVDTDLPVVELSYHGYFPEPWNGQTGLAQGRIWASSEGRSPEFTRWYDSVVRWIRKNFIRDRGVGLEGFIGPAAYEWFRQGGLLMPFFRPPETEAWLSWVDTQNQHRAAVIAAIGPE